MNLTKFGKLFHVVILGTYVYAMLYDMLYIPMLHKSYGGKFKFLTFIDLVSTVFRLFLRAVELPLPTNPINDFWVYFWVFCVISIFLKYFV